MVNHGVRTMGPIFSDAGPGAAVPAVLEKPARDWTWINWTLSLLTAPAAVLTMTFALARASGASACARSSCLGPGMGGTSFGLLFHAAPVIAALTFLLAFFFATHRLGFLVWIGGWILLAADLLLIVFVVL
ncbi:hypothetical protein [Mycolicibacter minnesotensis]|uniref:hypothetical protein n=2 Tax=Mycolicibacter minnesotensis TaxID=1118379 RepID=UPI0009F3BFFD|nr:hypothetical protein [Mycolicibacter minnesotensis]BBY32741.1 hypothetical protein MMIN_08020 [Mycolicibacter minnesotensis]